MTARVCDLLATACLYACLIVSAVMWGAHRGWPLAMAEILAFVAAGMVLLRMCAAGHLTWIPLPLAAPLLTFVALVGLQLAVGNGRLVAWAVAPAGAPADLPTPVLALGSVAPGVTGESLVLFLAYASAYFATAHVMRGRPAVERLVRTLVVLGAVLAVAGIVDYLAREPLIARWRDQPIGAGRLTGTFVNPDHFATWLAMLFFLGVGVLLGRRAHGEEEGESERREWLSRRALWLFGLTLIGVGLLLTLSRGGLLATAGGGLALVIALRARRLAGRNTAIIGGLAAATLLYAVWIGLGPLLERLAATNTEPPGRSLQAWASLPMLADFPVLGVGLGAYREIFPRYQPLALEPGRVYYPYAHDDLLQLALETGALGVAIFVWGLVALLRHAYLFLFGPERRHDRWTVYLALGALAGAATALLHASFDFSLRIPANGLLLATLLGLATVVLQTRFHGSSVSVLADVRSLNLESLPSRGAIAGATVAVVAAFATLAIRPALAAVPGPRLETRRDCEAALRARPTNPKLHFALARVAAQEEDFPTAVAQLERAVALAPEDGYLRASAAGLLSTMAEATPDAAMRDLLVRRGVEEARESARRVPDLLPLMLGWYVELGLPSDQLQALAPSDAVGRLELAVALERRGMTGDALTAYERAASAAAPPERALYDRFLAAARARAGDHAGAGAALETARRLDPDSVPIHLMLAQELAQTGEPAQALFYNRKALELAERAVQAPRQPGRGLAPRLSPRAEVLQELQLAAFGPAPTAPQEWLDRAQLALAQFHVDHGDFAEARPLLETLAQRPDASAAVEYALGLTYEKLGEWDRAQQALRRAIDRDPGNVAYREYLARGLWARERFFEALELWRAAAELQPRDVGLQLQLARAYERVGERVEAFKRYRQALSVDPSNQEARQRLTQLEGGPPR